MSAESPPGTTVYPGLTRAEAAERLRRDGPNALPDQGPRSLARIAREVLKEPMFLLLIAAAAVYLTLGDVREAIILGISIVAVVGITILQERRTERALAKLGVPRNGRVAHFACRRAHAPHAGTRIARRDDNSRRG